MNRSKFGKFANDGICSELPYFNVIKPGKRNFRRICPISMYDQQEDGEQ